MTGPYRACMKFEDVQKLLADHFGDVSSYEVKKILEAAFPHAQSDRSTYILGIRPSQMDATPAFSPETASQLSTVTPQQSSDMISSLTAENTRLHSRISELEAEIKLLQRSSVQLAVAEQQADHLTTHSFIAHGPDSLEHLHSFSIVSLMQQVKSEAPDLFRLFETLGNPRRNLQSEHLAIEEVKGMVSLSTLLNARSRKVKGLQLLIAIMLIARATSKQVSTVVFYNYNIHVGDYCKYSCLPNAYPRQ